MEESIESHNFIPKNEHPLIIQIENNKTNQSNYSFYSGEVQQNIITYYNSIEAELEKK